MGISQESQLSDSLRDKIDALGQRFLLYGDPAYSVSDFIEGPLRQGTVLLSAIETNFNERMSAVRIAVK